MAITKDTFKLNPDQADDLAREFDRQHGVTQRLIDSMNTDIGNMEQMITTLTMRVKGMDWSGWTAFKFDNDWDSEFKPAMERMTESMREFVPVLQRLRDGLGDTDRYLKGRAQGIRQFDHQS